MYKYKGKEIHPYESFYWNTTQEFFRGQLGGISRCVKTDDSLAVMELTDTTICLNSKVNGKQPSVADRIYSTEGCAVALTSGWMQKIAEPISVSMRGRNPDNPSNGNYKQRIEPNMSGVANTITSVQKDSMVGEPTGEYNDIDYGKITETNTRKVLCILQHKVGEEKIQWAVGRFVGIFKEEILRQGVYEESICKCGEYETGIQPCTSLFEKNNVPNPRQRNGLRDVRSDQEYRCASQGFQLSEQFTREFNDIVSQLSYEDTQTKECLSYLWKTCQGVQSMQQTLSALEEVWRPSSSALEYIQPQKYRIRKLTCRECFRLQGVDDTDIDTIQSAGISNSQQYKLADNSIVVDVLYHLFRKMFVETENESEQLTLF